MLTKRSDLQCHSDLLPFFSRKTIESCNDEMKEYRAFLTALLIAD